MLHAWNMKKNLFISFDRKYQLEDYLRFLIFFPQLKLQLASHVWTSEREKESRQPKIPIRELWNGSLSETKLE